MTIKRKKRTEEEQARIDALKAELKIKTKALREQVTGRVLKLAETAAIIVIAIPLALWHLPPLDEDQPAVTVTVEIH